MTAIKEQEVLKITPQERETGSEVDKWLELFSIFIHDIESPLATMKYLIRLLESGRYQADKARHTELVHSCGVALDRA